MHEVSQKDDSESDVEYVLTVQKKKLHAVDSKGPIYVEMNVRDYGTVKFQVDCGATVNVIPRKSIDSHQPPPPNTSLQMYNHSTIKPLGKTRLILTNTENHRKYNVEFEVTKEDLTPLLSRKAVEQMKLITVNYDNFKQLNAVAHDNLASILAQYNDVKVLGQFPGEAHLHVKENANPMQMPARRIPVSVKPQ